MKYLLILGAGEDQLASYREARHRGLATIGVDVRADAPGAGLADRFLQISTRHADAIADAVIGLPIVGVIAPAGDAAQPSVRKLATVLGLAPIVSEAAVRCSADKGAFRALVAEIGLPTYRSHQDSDDGALTRAAQDIGYPLMVKPSDSSGSKGISYVDAPSGLADAIGAARRHSATGEIILEEFVEGRHLSVEAFLADGEPVLFVVSERTTTGPPGMVTISHRTPAPAPPAPIKQQRHLRSAVRAIAAAIALRDGPLNLDLIVGWDGVAYFVEMGARLGGNGMPQLVRLATGVDTVAAAVAHACRQPFDVRPRFRRAAMLHILHTDTAGVLERLVGVELIQHSADVVACEVFVSAGMAVAPYVKAANKIGYVLLAGADLAQLEARRRWIDEVFRAVVVPAVTHEEALV